MSAFPHPRVWGSPVTLGATTLRHRVEMRGLMESKVPVPLWLKRDASTYADRMVGVVLHWQVVSDSAT